MSRQSKNQKKGRSKFLTGLLVIVILVVIFMLSFWVTSMILKFGNRPILPDRGTQAEATATPKPTYEQLERMVAEKDAKIRELEAKLSQYKEEEPLSLGGSSNIQEKPMPTAKATAKPTATAAPTKAPQTTQTPSATPATQTPPESAPSVSVVPPNAQGN